MELACAATATATTWRSFASGSRIAFKISASGSKFAPGNAFSISSRAKLSRDIGSPNLSRRLRVHSSWMTPPPGASGTTIYAAHRETHFAFIGELAVGDEIKVMRRDGAVFRFRVTHTTIAHWN